MLRVELHPEVYPELENSHAWYAKHSQKLGTEFLTEVDIAIHKISDTPNTWRLYNKKKSIHKYYLHRFPYTATQN